MNFKVVSTGQKIGNLNEDPKLRIYPEVNRFKLNNKAAKLLAVGSTDSVTMLADTDSKLIAVHAAIAKTNAKGEIEMKPVRLTDEVKAELEAAGEDIPMEVNYVNACKLGKNLEFSSGYTVNAIGLKSTIECELQETVSGADIGLDNVATVLVFSYAEETQNTEKDPNED